MYNSETPYGMAYSYTPPQKKRVSPVLLIVLGLVVFGFLGLVVWVVTDLNTEVAPEGWITHSPPGSGFSVKMPERPKRDSRTLNTEVGPVALQMDMVENLNRAYVVGYCDYPEDMVRNSDKNEILKGAMNGGARGTGGQLKRSQPITLNGHPGLEFWATIPDKNGKSRYRVYLVNNRLFQLGVIHDEGFEPNTELFFGSFELLKN